ncbi:MAG: hypothetical protein NTZ20_02210 [Candidatus Levybacteria bacterium]|nr:hypothetical protein [Candidatus Levybacteria bacterium]
MIEKKINYDYSNQIFDSAMNNVINRYNNALKNPAIQVKNISNEVRKDQPKIEYGKIYQIERQLDGFQEILKYQPLKNQGVVESHKIDINFQDQRSTIATLSSNGEFNLIFGKQLLNDEKPDELFMLNSNKSNYINLASIVKNNIFYIIDGTSINGLTKDEGEIISYYLRTIRQTLIN